MDDLTEVEVGGEFRGEQLRREHLDQIDQLLRALAAACCGEQPRLFEIGAVRDQRRLIDTDLVDALVPQLDLRLLALLLHGLVDGVDGALADLPGLGLEQHAHDGIVFVLGQLNDDAAEVGAAALVLFWNLTNVSVGKQPGG